MSAEFEIRAAIARQAQAWQSGQPEQIVADFAEDCTFIVPGKRVQGREAVQAMAADYFANFTQVEIAVQRIVVEGNTAAVEWSWREVNRQTGETSYAEDAIVLAVREGGGIQYWREYIDTTSPTEQH